MLMTKTAQEIHTELRALRSEIGIKTEIYLSIDASYDATRPVTGILYPFGMSGEGQLFVRGAGFDEVIAALRAEWDERKADFAKETTKKMALAIIRITDELGTCSDAALRVDFDAAQIAQFGVEACTLADTMASKGPFSIIATSGKNAGVAV
jgi:hypothetical protein